MIGYITVGTNDLDKASAYYDELLSLVGASRLYERDNFVAWSSTPGTPAFSVIKPYDGNPATVGNGVMISLIVKDSEAVDAFYSKAIELGGTDEGKPGIRREGAPYIAYFRDLDGNKIAVFTMPTA